MIFFNLYKEMKSRLFEFYGWIYACLHKLTCLSITFPIHFYEKQIFTLSMSVLAYWKSLLCELKMITERVYEQSLKHTSWKIDDLEIFHRAVLLKMLKTSRTQQQHHFWKRVQGSKPGSENRESCTGRVCDCKQTNNVPCQKVGGDGWQDTWTA